MIASTQSIADTTLSYSDIGGNPSITLLVTSNKIRISQDINSSSYIVYDIKNTSYAVFDGVNKTYYIWDKEAIEGFFDFEKMLFKALEKEIGEMPESQKQLMINAIKYQEKKKPVYTYKFTKKEQLINDYKCNVVKRKLKRIKSEFCVTNYSEIGISPLEYLVIQSYKKTNLKILKSFSATSSMEFFDIIDYIPIKYIRNGKTILLNSVDHNNIDTSLLSITVDFIQNEAPSPFKK